LPNTYSSGWHLHQSLFHAASGGNALAPNRVLWVLDNKGAMCRLVGGMGDAVTHIENRTGEPAANPYLHMGSQIVAGLDGMANRTDPGGPLSDPYAQTQMPLLPTSLGEAVDALAASTMYRAALGGEFIDHYVSVRRQEIGRFQAHVTDWEHRAYFEAF
jgi:glutamine synthetase